jgi:tetratricopeptide (TPR) repeat protein
MFLTPIYAGPEILRGEPATVTSDVYSLGVILYELLAGRRPFDASKLGPAGLVHAVTSTDPPPPGKDRDLDSIALKALARNPEDRYGSAAQLADDLRRYLDGLPVAAVARSRWYVARKFVRRNRLAVTAAAVLLLSMAAGLAGTLWEARNAEQRFNDARRLANYLLFDLYDAVSAIPGTMTVRADMAQRALQYLDRLAAAKGNDPALRLELANGYIKLGDVLGHRLGYGDTLGDTAQAIDTDRKAMALAAPLVRQHPQNLDARRALATARERLGVALNIAGRFQEAMPFLRQAADSFEQIAASRPHDQRSLKDAATAWYVLGKQLSEKGAFITFDADMPLVYLRRAVGEFQSALRISPNNAEITKLLALTYESLGRIDSLREPGPGMADYTAALDLVARLPGTEQKTVDVQRLRAMMLVHLGWDKGQLNDYKGALADLEQARPVLDLQAAADPQNVGAAFRRVDLYRSLGLIHGYAGHKSDSLENLRKAVEILAWAAPRDPGNDPADFLPPLALMARDKWRPSGVVFERVKMKAGL